jgi:hypothetical protein
MREKNEKKENKRKMEREGEKKDYMGRDWK